IENCFGNSPCSESVAILADWTCNGISKWFPGVANRGFISTVPRGIALAFCDRWPRSSGVHADFEHHPFGVVDKCCPRQGFGLSLRNSDRLLIGRIGRTEIFEPELVEEFLTTSAQLLCTFEIVTGEFTAEERSQQRHWVLAVM